MAWVREITSQNGSIGDRVAEIGNILLNEGFPIIINNQDMLHKAINGDFKPECKRWILAREQKFCIKWEFEDKYLYKYARKLPGSKWERPYVTVKSCYVEEIKDFAEIYDFQFDKTALELMKKEEDKKKIVVNPTKIEKEKEDKLEKILKVEAGVIDDLKD